MENTNNKPAKPSAKKMATNKLDLATQVATLKVKRWEIVDKKTFPVGTISALRKSEMRYSNIAGMKEEINWLTKDLVSRRVN